MNPQHRIRLRARGQRWAMTGAALNPGIVFIAVVDGMMYCHEVDANGNRRRTE